MTTTNISVSYGHKKVLDRVDLGVGHGEVVGLIGMNGAGKSTLVGVLAGMIQPSTGERLLAGERFEPDSPAAAQAAGIGLIVQNFAPDPTKRVTEVLFANTFRAGQSHKELRERALELVQEAGVDLDVDARIGDLDRGTQALVEVTRMLAEEAQFVIMDEVAATLADHEIAVLHHVMRELVRQGRGVLYITHRLDELLSIADRVVLLNNGKITGARSARNTNIHDLARLLDADHKEPTRPDPLAPVSGAAPAIELVSAGVKDAFDDVSLQFSRGQITALIGAPRSGAREVAEVLGAQRMVDSGTVLREGWPLDFLKGADALGIGYLPDQFDEDEGRLVDQAGKAGNLQGEIRRARRMIELVKELRISTTDIKQGVEALSGGDRQKSALVRRMEAGHELLVLVHPTRGIDVVSRGTVFEVLRSMASQGAAVVVLTADLSEVMQWADRVVVMREGRVVVNAANQDVDEDSLAAQMLGHAIYSGTARRAR